MEKIGRLLHLLMEKLMGLLGVKTLKHMTDDLLQLLERTVRLLLEKTREAAEKTRSLCMGKITGKNMVVLMHDLLRDAIGFIVLKLDEVLQPETRAEAFRAFSNRGRLAQLAALILFCIICRILYACCLCLFGCFVSLSYEASMLLFGFISGCCRFVYGVCCLCAQGLGITMMKAPGAGGLLIPRFLFESCPRLYFIGQRTARGLLGFCSGKHGLVACLGGFVVWSGFKLLSGIVRPTR